MLADHIRGLRNGCRRVAAATACFDPARLVQRFGRLSERPWSAESVLRLLMALFLMLGVMGLVAYGIDMALGQLPKDTRRYYISIVSTFGFQGAALALVHQFLRSNQLAWTDAFGLNRPGLLGTVFLAAGVAILVFPVNLSLMWVSQRLMEWRSIQPVAQPAVEALQTTTRVDQKLALGWLAIVMAPLVEEVLFRGVFYPGIKQAGFPRAAFWLTALVFALTHANVMTFLPLTFFAMVLTLLYEYTDNLLAPMLTHSLFNAANYFWLLWETGLRGPG
jgi:membrane protease YdiL (CAAX protease family)